MPSNDDLTNRDRNRYALLRGVYEKAGKGNEAVVVPLKDVAASLEIDEGEAVLAYQYLTGEGLLARRAMGGVVSITHQGVREVEASLRNPERATEHFSVPVIQHVHQHFHGPVGAVQTGERSTATVHQTIGPGMAEVVALVERLRAALPAGRDDLLELADALEDEARRAAPKRSLMVAMAERVQRILEAIPGNVAGGLVVELLKALAT